MSKNDYTKTLTLSIDNLHSNIKFFYNPLFRKHIQEYLLNSHHIESKIQLLQTQDIFLTLTGEKKNVKTALQTIPNLFELIQMKVFNNKEIHQKIIYWSQQITSDLIIPVIQQIMDQQKIFTIWEKTTLFYGYFKVIYFIHESFKVSENEITEILNNQIEYIENIEMPKEITKQFLNDIDQFIASKQNSELAIIHCKYPYKSNIKISLFGQRKLVKNAKKQLQSIIHKHTIKTVQMKIDTNQHEYLLDNCIEQLDDIENEYKNDNVKIRIRLKEFSSPQYLLETIEKKIQKLLPHRIVCQYEQIGNSILLTDYDYRQLNRLVYVNYGRIDQIETKTIMKVYSIPKASSTTSNISNSLIQQSNEFFSSLSMRKISVLNGSIEIYLTNQSSSIPRDITIISSQAGATEEHIDVMSDNGYLEMKTGRKFLFHRWTPTIATNDERENQKLKKSIEKFISSALQGITACYTSAETIVFQTNEWENIGLQLQQQQLLANCLINEVKQYIITRKLHWRILFIFNNQQMNLYKEFYEIFIKLQTNQDGFAQFVSPVSIIQITLTTSSNLDQIKCENEVNKYIQKYILVDKNLTNEIDIIQWDQNMINAFYKYCLTKLVLPKIELIKNLQIHLIGSIRQVEKAIEKYKLMSDILKQKSSLRIPPPVTPRKTTHSNSLNRIRYNIYFSYCQNDQTFCNRIKNYLVSESYSIYETSTNTTSLQSFMDKSDVILIAFSENYSNNKQSIAELNYAKSINKLLIPFVIRNNTEDSYWLSSLTVNELFYDLFDCEIDLEFYDDFDLEYDKLLCKLLRYTKPGITGITYPETHKLPQIIRNDEDYEVEAFGRISVALQKLTPEQHAERKEDYQLRLTEKMAREKIPDDEIEELVEVLQVVINDSESVLQELNDDTKLNTNENDTKNEIHRDWKLGTIRDCINRAQRWLSKSSNMIQGNITPFTPTGDINDAIFIIHYSSNDPTYMQNSKPFDHSSPAKYFSTLNSYMGSGFNMEQAHEYCHRLFKNTKSPHKNEKHEIIKQADHTLFLSNELRTPEEMQKLEELDNLNRIWKVKPDREKFVQQKIKNILEFKELCEKSM
ncbi:unnamed protein product [Rotaria sordida]|uniref:TIR domain-containing protein n=2 Tax=Rotaria sordida TaxID=392033 RepID=A0A819DQA1_9BILA|nr:unnamed protein product [Rotaria sordida]CAF3833301.1 unnamed protein product [Rotaria sordida]